VAASGNVTHAELLTALERTGWHAEPRGPGETFVSPVPVPAASSEQFVACDSQQVNVVFGSATVPHSDPRRYALILVNTLLGGGMSSRLFQRLREELGLVYSVYSFQSFHVDAGVHGVYLGTAPGTAKQAVAAVRDELARLVMEGFSPAELQSGKQQVKGQITLSMESVTSRMYRAAAVELFDEPYAPLDEVLARIDAIDEGDVRDVCARFFTPERQTVLGLGPT